MYKLIFFLNISYDFKNVYILKGFIPVWLRGIYNACYLTTSNVTDAVSPAFVIPGMYKIDI